MSDYKKIKVDIIDLKVHNIHNIYNACKYAGYQTNILNPDQNKINSDILILPGVGSFKFGMYYIKKKNLNNKIQDFLYNNNSKLLLGICLGMQLLFSKSEEFGNCKGLNLIDGEIKKLRRSNNLKIPHIGWNKIISNNYSFSNYLKNKSFYFIHSYCAYPKNKKEVFGETNYGKYNFCSVVKKNNIIGTQFHPEKSSEDGIDFLKKLTKFL